MRRKAGMPTQEMPKPFLILLLSRREQNSYRCHIIISMAGMKTDSRYRKVWSSSTVKERNYHHFVRSENRNLFDKRFWLLCWTQVLIQHSFFVVTKKKKHRDWEGVGFRGKFRLSQPSLLHILSTVHLSETEESGISVSSWQTFHKLREVATFAPKTGTERELKSFLNPLESIFFLFRPRLQEVPFVLENWIRKGKTDSSNSVSLLLSSPACLYSQKKGSN